MIIKMSKNVKKNTKKDKFFADFPDNKLK